MALTEREIEGRVRDGFIHLPGAVPRRTALRCQDELWRVTGYDPQGPRPGSSRSSTSFPSTEDPGDAGWHVEASFSGAEDELRLNLRSRGRALLALFLFTEVDEDNAPTRARVGSHLDVPPALEGAGEAGMGWMAVCEKRA